MDAIFKRVTYLDEWLKPNRFLGFGATSLRPIEMKVYALGYRFEANPRELQLIECNEMFGHWALVFPDWGERLTFADLLSPELVPEVHWSEEHLLEVEGMVRAAAAKWTHFFESMDDCV